MSEQVTSAGFRDRSKRWLRLLIPAGLWTVMAKIYHLAKVAPVLCVQVPKNGWPDFILYFGYSPGDDLLCTVVARELKRRGARSLWMASYHPDLFFGNPDIDLVAEPGPWLHFAKRWSPGLIPSLWYSEYDPVKDIGISPDRHILTIMCASAGMRGTIELLPRLHLTHEELENQSWARECIAIQSSGLQAASPMLNKQWPAKRFNEIASQLAATHRVVQIGQPGDPLLEGADDLRGRTSLREAAAILSHARLYIGTVGMLMHLARAVNCRSVILYGGRERPWQSGYACNVNLTSEVSCSPCWRYNACDHERICMNQISTTDAANAVLHCLNDRHDALPVTVETIE